MYFPAAIFALPAFVDREYYQTRFEKSKVQPNFWINTYYVSAIAYAWIKIFNENRESLGWKQAMKLADAEEKTIRDAFDKDMKFYKIEKK